MSEKNQVVVVMIAALSLGAFLDRVTALKMIAGAILLWGLQNQPAVWDSIRKLFSMGFQPRAMTFVREYRGDSKRKQ